MIETHAGAKVIPSEALLFNEGQPYVFVLQGTRVKRTGVTLGVDGGEWVEVLSGLELGAKVVSAGADGLGDGSPVRVGAGPETSTTNTSKK